MAFGIKRNELNEWKRAVLNGEVAFLTHYWLDDRYPDVKTVTRKECRVSRKRKDRGQIPNALILEWHHPTAQ